VKKTKSNNDLLFESCITLFLTQSNNNAKQVWKIVRFCTRLLIIANSTWIILIFHYNYVPFKKAHKTLLSRHRLELIANQFIKDVLFWLTFLLVKHKRLSNDNKCVFLLKSIHSNSNASPNVLYYISLVYFMYCWLTLFILLNTE
jgi:hypothetical protein